MDDTLTALRRLALARAGDTAMSETGGDGVTYGELFRMIAALTREYRSLPPAVGLLAPGGIAWVAASLALMASGRTVVPLPDFFSQDQLSHIVADAGIGHVLAIPATRNRARGLGVAVSDIALPEGGKCLAAVPDADAAPDGRLVIYTSGSTGHPKGVCLGMRQLASSATALGRATGAGAADIYLSVLPISLLLEQVCAIHVPLQTGVRVVFATGTAAADLTAVTQLVQPTLMVLVPQLLAAWTAALARRGAMAPTSLRFVATGGAPVPEPLAASAWRLGIPVHEGYGLSECCAVVALNRPGDRAPGTVGRPIDGVTLALDDGEIVVRGPTVMDGYLNRTRTGPDGVWRTGDLGAFDRDGRLIVLGRRDSMLVTAAGRNIVPEWIEAMVTADPRVAHCILTPTAGGAPAALIVPHDAFGATLREMTAAQLDAHVAALVADAPSYARPVRCLVVGEAELRHRGLLTGNGRPRRGAIRATFPFPETPATAVA